jgi:hypothetical protein
MSLRQAELTARRHGEVVILTQAERFEFFLRLLAPEDYEFIRTNNPGIEKRFRRDRFRVCRLELFAIFAETGAAYRRRLSRIHQASLYGRIIPLMWDTAMAFLAAGQLSLVAALFFWRIPAPLGLESSAGRLLKYLTSEAPSPESLSQPA